MDAHEVVFETEACRRDPALITAINVMKGRIVHPAMAAAYGKIHSAPELG